MPNIKLRQAAEKQPPARVNVEVVQARHSWLPKPCPASIDGTLGQAPGLGRAGDRCSLLSEGIRVGWPQANLCLKVG